MESVSPDSRSLLSRLDVVIKSSVYVLVFCAGAYYVWRKSKGIPKAESSKCPYNNEISKQNGRLMQTEKAKQKEKAKKAKAHPKTTRLSPQIKEKATQHPLYCGTFKGFTREVTSVSINCTGTKVVVASSDSTIRVFTVDPFSAESLTASLERQIYVRGVISGDYCTAVDLSFDDNNVFGATENSCKLVRFHFKKVNSTSTILENDKISDVAIHKNSIRWLSSSKGKWIVTASEGADTDIFVFTYSFEKVASIDTKQVRNFHLNVSPLDGRFFGVAAWSPGVKVMEIVTSKSGDVKKVEKATDLQTPCGVNAVAFSHDNKLAALCCKDGTLMLWNIDIRYQANEDAKKLLVKKDDSPEPTNSQIKNYSKGYSQLGFSSDKMFLVGVNGRMIQVLKVDTLEVVETIEEASEVPIRSLYVSPHGQFFVTGAVDSKPRVWKLPGMES